MTGGREQSGKGTMSWLTAGLIMFGFAAPSACVGVPYSVGAVGLVWAPVVCILVTLASGLGAFFLFELTQRNPGCDSLPALGQAVGGSFGRKFGLIIQQGNFVMYLPVAMLVCAQGAQDAIDPKGKYLSGCVDYWILIVAGICLSTTQLRSLNHMTALSFISLICVIATIIIAVAVVCITENDDKVDAVLIGNPEMKSSSDEQLRGWMTFLIGVSTTAWAYVPTFLTVELANDRIMANPDDFPKAIALAGVLNCLVYTVVGLVVVMQWGWDVMDPLMLGTVSNFGFWPSDHAASRTLNCFWFVACLISYALDSVPLGRQCQRSWAPDFDINDWSVAACIKYLLITMPTFVAALLMAFFVPSLFCMLTIVTALTVPWVNNIFPAYLYWRSHKVRLSGTFTTTLLNTPAHEDEITMRKKRALPAYGTMYYVLGMGVILFLVCAIGAVGKLGLRDLRGPVKVGCPGWQILDE